VDFATFHSQIVTVTRHPKFFRISLILPRIFVSALSDGIELLEFPAGLVVTSRMTPVRFFSSLCVRISMVSFGIVRRPSLVVFARKVSSS